MLIYFSQVIKGSCSKVKTRDHVIPLHRSALGACSSGYAFQASLPPSLVAFVVSYHMSNNTLKNTFIHCHVILTQTQWERTYCFCLRLRSLRLRGSRKCPKSLLDSKLQKLNPCSFWFHNPWSSPPHYLSLKSIHTGIYKVQPLFRFIYLFILVKMSK